MQKTPHSRPQSPRTGTLLCLSARLPRSSGASTLCRPPPPPICWPFASLLAARFRQPLAGLLFHGLNGGQGRGRHKLRARPRGLLPSAAAAANDRAGPQAGRSRGVASVACSITRAAPQRGHWTVCVSGANMDADHRH